MPSLFAAKICFWHLPKTGGTWLCTTLERAGVPTENLHPMHATPAEMPQLLAAPVQATIAREPYAWHWSVWRYLRRNDATDAFYRRFEGLGDDELRSFEAYCVRYAGLYRKLLAEYRPPQCLILRAENLAEDLVAMLRLAGVAADIGFIRRAPRVNVTPGDEPAPANPDLRRFVLQSEGFRP